MLPIPRDDGTACDNCPFWGGEAVAAKVRCGGADGGDHHAVVIFSTCRAVQPHEAVGQFELTNEHRSALGGGLIVGHGWTPAKYWCGRHPAIDPKTCGLHKPKATHIVLGEPSLEPAPPQPKGT